MNTSLRKWLIYMVSVALLTASSLVMASGNHDDDDDDDGYHFNGNICKKTADKMLKSCRYEVKEEYYAEKAKCMNLAEDDLEDRDECLEEVKQARKEDKELCADQRAARRNLCNLLPDREASGYGPEAFLYPENFETDPGTNIVNPYFSLAPGHTYVSRVTGGEDDDGEAIEETVVVTVTDETITVMEDEGAGVECRLVVDIVLVDGEEGEKEAVEVTDDYYAQAVNGDVHYCGEVSRNFEDGHLVDLDGSFLVGLDGAKSGILIKANPISGDVHRQEWLLGEAEDAITYVAGADATTSVGAGEGGENPNFPCAGGCVKTEEFIPPEPESGEFKYFISGTGFVLGVALEDGGPSGEREELLCTGDSLTGVLDDCSIDALTREDLCKLSNAFCIEEI